MIDRHATYGIGKLAVAALVLPSLAMLSACHRASVEEVETTAVVPVAIAIVKTDLLRSVIAVTGVVAAAPGAEMLVVAPAAARIAEIPFAEGDRVQAGQVLVRFDIPTLTADVAASNARVMQATARVQAASANVTRLASLLGQGVAAPRDVEDARRQLAEAEGDLAEARSGVTAASTLAERATVRARFAGVIAQRFHNPGDLVEAAASDPILRVVDPSQLQVVASVPASELSRVVVGHSAEIRQGDDDDGEAATVVARAPVVDPSTATGSVRLRFAKPTTMAAGMTVQIDIAAEERARALVVPASSIVSTDGELFVMVVGADNKAHKHPVTVGLTTRTLADVTSGVVAGDRVIVRGQANLPDGAAVSIETK